MAQRIVFPEVGRVELQEFEPSPLQEGEVLVRTAFSLMSIGTELTILHSAYDSGTHFDRMFSFPQLKTGVQAVGRVEQVAADVDDIKEGDTVFMRQAHGSHQVLAASECSQIPDELDRKNACWAGLAKTAFRAAWAGSFSAGGEVLVIGAGPVGRMLVRWAAATGMSQTVVTDLSGYRLQRARDGGATHCLEGSLQQSGEGIAEIWPAGAPLIVDATGNAAVFADALKLAAPFGKVILLGDTGYPARQTLTSDLMTKGLTVQATHDSHDVDGWTQRRVDEHFFAQVTSGRFPLDGLISHEFQPRDCETAYATARNHRAETLGILFDWRDTK